jgi:hypothetical protein
VLKVSLNLSVTACINFEAAYFRLWKKSMLQTKSFEVIISFGSEVRRLHKRITYRQWFRLKHTTGQAMKEEWGTHLKQKHLI